MSAVWAPLGGEGTPGTASRGSSRLRAVAPPTSRLSRAPFLLVLIAVFGLGMAGLLMLNTTLQNQAFTARDLNRQATELAYTQADLENQLDVLSAPPELARRASALGMRPNPYPALLRLPDGKVLGEPTAVAGTEVPSMVVKTPAEVAAARAAAEDRAKAEAAAAEAAAEKKAAEKKAAEKKAAEKKAADQQAVKKAEAKTKAADRPGDAAEQGGRG